jgi:hypothetical protein
MAPGVGICTSPSPGVDVVCDASFAQSHLPAFSEAENIVNPFSGAGQSLCGFLATDQQPQSFPIPRLSLNFESPHENNIIGRLLEQEGISFDEKTKLQLLEKKITLRNILEAGLKALSHEIPLEVVCSSSHAGQGCAINATKLRTDKILVLKNANTEYTTPLPDIRKNHIRIKQVMFTAACIANASSLGFTLGGEDCDEIESPFFRDTISESAAKTVCLREFTDLNTYLRPTATQMMHRHHPYIDVLPFPTFRERVIKLACVEEPMIDEDDLCADLQNDGLVCWGSSLGGGSSAMGSGAPWDLRSWEAQPWFLKKWWILIGGAEGEIYKQTQWWCEMRGERSCYPW